MSAARIYPKIIKTGTVLHADLSEMLGTIFMRAPLCMMAQLLCATDKLRQQAVLPLSTILKSVKTWARHRAALGMSENSDAVIVVVSETGIISLAKNGVLIRRLDRQEPV